MELELELELELGIEIGMHSACVTDGPASAPCCPGRCWLGGGTQLQAELHSFNADQRTPTPVLTICIYRGNAAFAIDPRHTQGLLRTVETEISVQIFSVQRLSAQTCARAVGGLHSALQSTMYSDH